MGVLNAGLSAGSAILSLWLPHVQPMIMILTSDPTKLNQVCVLWPQEEGVVDVFICTEDPCLRWVTDLNFSWHRIDDGGVRSEEGSLSSRFIFLLCSRTAYLPRVDHLDLYWGVKTPRWRAGSYSNTGIRAESWDETMHHPPHFITVKVGANRVQVSPHHRSLAGVRCRTHPHTRSQSCR